MQSNLESRIFKRIGKAVYAYIWLFPVLVILGVVLLYPWIMSFFYSFSSWSPIYPEPSVYVGINNYIEVFQNSDFWLALKNTIYLMMGSVSIQLLLGLCLALMLNTKLRGRNIFSSLYLVPMMLTPSIIGLIWKPLLHSEWGIINYILKIFGIAGQRWLGDPSVTMSVIIGIEIWQHTSFVIIIFLAGLQSLPPEQIEAAQVDGANGFSIFRYITLPWLRPLIIVVVLFRLIFAIRSFDVIYVLWRSGGPARAGLVLGNYLYEQFRVTWDLGWTSAISFVLLAITSIIGITFAMIAYRKPNI